MVLLQANGVLNNVLRWLRVIDEPLRLMYNETGVVIGMAQVLLPFHPAAVCLPAEHRSAAVPRRPEHGGGAVAAFLLAYATAEHAGHGHRGAARLCPGARFLHHAPSPRWLSRDHPGDGDPDPGRPPS